MVSQMEKYSALAAPINNLPVLDFGCGWGYLLQALQCQGMPCEGVDIDLGQVEVAARFGLLAHHADDSLQWLGTRIFGGACWSTVFMLDVLEHLDANDQLVVLKLIYQALPVGGRLVIRVPNPDSAVGGRMRYIDYTHKFTPTSDALANALRVTGFVSVEVRDELPWSDPVAFRPWDMLFAESWVRRNLWIGWYYRISQGFFRWLRRREIAAEIGLEKARHLPLAPNYVCIADK